MNAGLRKAKACDGCRFRKVKCHGLWPCTQCAHLNIACTFATPPTSQRRRGRRGWLVAQLRGERENEHAVQSSPRRQSPEHGARSEQSRPPDFFLGLLPQYAEFVYPLNPIISPPEMKEAIRNMNQSDEDSALVHAFAAITVNRMRSSWALHKGVAVQMTELVRCSTRAHRAYELSWDDDRDDGILEALPVTAKRILTCVFLSVCALTLGRVDRSFAWLREGITMFQALDFRQSPPGGPDEAARWQRLYWELFLHERHVALLPSFGSVLPAPSWGPPVSDTSIPGHIDLGFRRLINLFAILDDKFLHHWRSQHKHSINQSTESTLTTQWLEQKHGELDQDAAGTAEEERLSKDRGANSLTELQHIDLAITRLWLRTMLWQLALSQGLLASTTSMTNHEGLSFQFPVNSLYTEFRSVFSRLQDVTSVGFHGMGMLEKLFEVTSTIADVMVVTSHSGHIEDEHISRVKYLLFLFEFLSGFDAVASKQRNYLLEKLQALKGMYTMIDFDGVVFDESDGTSGLGAISPVPAVSAAHRINKY